MSATPGAPTLFASAESTRGVCASERWEQWQEDRATDVRCSVEFEVPESEYDKIRRLIGYAKRIGVTAYSTNSHDASRPGR